MAKAKTKTRKKARQEEPDEEIEDELEELDDDSDEPAPKRKRKKSSGENGEVTFGVADLCALVEERTGNVYSTREMRTLLRKLARDGKIEREIVPGNRARYDWSGPNDAEVKRVLKAVEAGEIEKSKKEALDALKERGAKKKAEKEKATSKKGKAKVRKREPEPEDEDFEEIDELDEDED